MAEDITSQTLKAIQDMQQMMSGVMKDYNQSVQNLEKTMIAQVKATAAIARGEKGLQKEMKKSTKFTGSMDDALKDLVSTEKEANEHLTKTQKVLKGIMAVGTIRVWQEFSQGSNAAVDAASEIQGLNDNLYALTQVTGASKESLKDFRSFTFATTRELAAMRIAAEPDEIAEAMKDVVSAGVRGQESIKAYTKSVVMANKATGVATGTLAELFYQVQESWGMAAPAGEQLVAMATKIAERFNISTERILEGFKGMEEEMTFVTSNMDEQTKKVLVTSMSHTMGMMESMFIKQGDEIGKTFTSLITNSSEAYSKLGWVFSEAGIGMQEAQQLMQSGRTDVLFAEMAKGVSTLVNRFRSYSPDAYAAAMRNLSETTGLSIETLTKMADKAGDAQYQLRAVMERNNQLAGSFEDTNVLQEKAAWMYSRIGKAMEVAKAYILGYGGVLVDVFGDVFEALWALAQTAGVALIGLNAVGIKMDDVAEYAKTFAAKLGILSGHEREVAEGAKELVEPFKSMKKVTDKLRGGVDKVKASFIDWNKTSKIMSDGTEKITKKIPSLTDVMGMFEYKLKTVGRKAKRFAQTIAFDWQGGFGAAGKAHAAYNAVMELGNKIMMVSVGLFKKMALALKLDAVWKYIVTGATWLWTAALAAASLAMNSVIWPILAVTGGLALLGAAIYGVSKGWDFFTSIIAKATNWVAGAMEKTIEWVTALPDKITAFFYELPGQIEALFMQTGGATESGLGKAFTRLMKAVPKLVWTLFKFMWWDVPFKIMPSIALALFRVAGIMLFEGILKLGPLLKNAIVGLFKGLAGIPELIFDIFTTPFRVVMNWIGNLFGVDELGSQITDGIKGIAGSILDVLIWPFKKAWNFIFGGFGDMLADIMPVITGYGGVIVDAILWPFRKAFEMLWGLLDVLGLGPMMDKLMGIGGWIYDVIVQPFKDAWNWLFGNTLWDFDVIAQGITAVSQSIYDALLWPFAQVWEGIKGIWGEIGPYLKGVVARAWDMLPAIIKKPIEWLFGGPEDIAPQQPVATGSVRVQQRAAEEQGTEAQPIVIDQTPVIDKLDWLGNFIVEALTASEETQQKRLMLMGMLMKSGGTNMKGLQQLFADGVI